MVASYDLNYRKEWDVLGCLSLSLYGQLIRLQKKLEYNLKHYFDERLSSILDQTFSVADSVICTFFEEIGFSNY